MNDFVKYVIYFLLGGTIVSVSTYLGSQGKSFLAPFASTWACQFMRCGGMGSSYFSGANGPHSPATPNSRSTFA